jgi:hypothetical protein
LGFALTAPATILDFNRDRYGIKLTPSFCHTPIFAIGLSLSPHPSWPAESIKRGAPHKDNSVF